MAPMLLYVSEVTSWDPGIDGLLCATAENKIAVVPGTTYSVEQVDKVKAYAITYQYKTDLKPSLTGTVEMCNTSRGCGMAIDHSLDIHQENDKEGSRKGIFRVAAVRGLTSQVGVKGNYFPYSRNPRKMWGKGQPLPIGVGKALTNYREGTVFSPVYYNSYGAWYEEVEGNNYDVYATERGVKIYLPNRDRFKMMDVFKYEGTYYYSPRDKFISSKFLGYSDEIPVHRIMLLSGLVGNYDPKFLVDYFQMWKETSVNDLFHRYHATLSTQKTMFEDLIY